MRPPRNFFGGLANLLTRGHWGTPEAMETYNRARQSTPISQSLQQQPAHSRCRVPPHLGADLGTMPRDTPRGVRLWKATGMLAENIAWKSQAGTEHRELLQPTSEVQEETHISRTAGGVKLIFGETSLEHNMATERPVDSQDGLNDTFIKNGESMMKGSGITA